MTRATVVVPTYRSGRWLAACLEALADQSFRDFNVLVVDGGSDDDTVEAAWRAGVETIELAGNPGFAPAVNAGLAAARSPYVALLNPDTRAERSWLEHLVAALDAAPSEVLAVTSRILMLDRPGRIDDAGDTLSWYGSAAKRGHGRPAAEFERPGEVFSASGAAALFRRDALVSLGGFDERFRSYFEDVDLGLRARLAGWRVLYEPRARVLHKGYGSAIPRRRYVTLVTGNRLMTLAKSLPLRHLVGHLGKLVWGQLYFLVAYRQPLASAAGYARFLAALPHVLAARRRILAGRKISDAELDALLEPELGEPPLRELVRRKLR